MDKMSKDILAETSNLKEMPYSVPEGYFGLLKAEIKARPQKTAWTRLMPYVSMAAVFIFLVTAGTLILQRFTPAEDLTQEDFLVFSPNALNIEYYSEETNQYAIAGIEDEDIIEYLIYSRISAEEIENAK